MKPGDTLSKIAKEHLGHANDYMKIFNDGAKKSVEAFGKDGAMQKNVKLPFGEFPGIGDSLRAPFESAADAGLSLQEAGQGQQDLVHRIAWWLGVLLALIPITLVLIRYLPARLSWIREASAAHRLRIDASDLQLFALRAITNRPEIFDRSVIRSSVSPSAKYSCSSSALRLVNGRMAIEGRSDGGGMALAAGIVLSVPGSQPCHQTMAAAGMRRRSPPPAISPQLDLPARLGYPWSMRSGSSAPPGGMKVVGRRKVGRTTPEDADRLLHVGESGILAQAGAPTEQHDCRHNKASHR